MDINGRVDSLLSVIEGISEVVINMLSSFSDLNDLCALGTASKTLDAALRFVKSVNIHKFDENSRTVFFQKLGGVTQISAFDVQQSCILLIYGIESLTHLEVKRWSCTAAPNFAGKELSKLKSLHLREVKCPANVIQTFFPTCINLTRLEMDHVLCLNDSVLQRMPSLHILKRLSISRCFQITDVSPITSLKSLVELKVYQCPNLRNLFGSAHEGMRITNLKTLCVNSTSISTKSLTHALSICPMIEVLAVRACKFVRGPIAIVAPHLVCVDMRRCVELQGLDLQCEALSQCLLDQCDSLSSLIISSGSLCNLNLKFLARLATLRLNCPSLRALHVMGCTSLELAKRDYDDSIDANEMWQALLSRCPLLESSDMLRNRASMAKTML